MGVLGLLAASDVGLVQYYQRMFEASPVALALADEAGLLVLANDAYCTLVGRSLAEILGHSSREFTHVDDLAQHAAMQHLMAAAEAVGDTLRVEKRYQRPDGSVRWGWVSVASIAGPEGQGWTMAVVQDTTERKDAEDALQDAATTDSLTGLLNRRGWRDALNQLILMGEHVAPLTLAVLDLDHFKVYNDTHGHPAGDHLLRGFARRARRSLRGADVLARWGGEEFALALPRCARNDAEAVLADLAALVPAEQTFSAGFTTLRAGESVADCWDRADTLLYRAKRRGRNRVITDPA